MANNVAASMTASIVIDKKELISNALAAYASAQKELDGNKIELLIDVSSDEARNKLKEIQKELSGKEYIIKFKNQGIEETIKSLDELANKIKDIISGKSIGNGKGLGNSFVDEETIKKTLDLFTKMEDHLNSMRKVFADVGDGEEFSPLLKMINDVQKAVSNLGETVGKIKLNVNIESKGTDEQLLAKIEQRKQVLLNAYRDQFNAMRKIKPSGADVINSFGLASKSGSTVAALNKSINMFDESSLDSLDQKISAYEDMIKKLKRLSELSYGTNIYDGMDKSFGNKVSAAKGSLTKAINSLDSNSPDGLEGLFGKTDLSGVITQLETIADKLDKISKSASEFATSFKEGFNVNASIEELNKLTDRVKELEEELAKLKVSPVVSDRTPATSSPMKDVFQGGTTSAEKLEEEIKNIDSATEKASESAKEYRKILSQVGEFDIDSKVSAMYKRNDGQLESWTWRAKKDDEGNVLYDQNGKIDYDEPTITVISKYEQLEKIIVKADNELRNLQKDLAEIKAYDPTASTTNVETKISDQKEYIRLLEQTVKVISQSDEYLLNEQQIIEARNKAAREYALTTGAKQEKTDAKQSASDEKKRLANIEQVNRALNKQQIAIDAIEKTYNKTTNPDLDREVSNQQDLAELAQKKLAIQTKINSLQGQERNSANEKEFLELEKLIAEYKELAKYKLKSNNPSKQELGGQNLQTLIQVQISNYDKLITKAEKYGDATSETVEKLKEQRDILSKTVSDGRYSATADQYYASRDTYKVESAALSAFEAETKAAEQEAEAVQKLAEEKRKLRQQEKQNTQSSVDKALKDQVSAWKQIQSIREKITKTDDADVIALLQESKKYYQEQYINASKILKANDGLYDKESQIAKLEQIRLETNAKITALKNKQLKNNSEQEAKAFKEEWDKNVEAIQDYMDAVTKLNNLNAKDKGTGEYSSQIALQEKIVEELKEKAFEARAAISSMINPHDVPLNTWRDYLDVMEKFDQASLGSAESVAKLKDALANMSKSKIESMESSLKSYQDKAFNLSIKPDDAHRFPEYQAQLDSINKAIKDYEAHINSLRNKGIIDESDIKEANRLDEVIKNLLRDTKKFSSGDKGFTNIGADKVLEKIHSILEQNSRMSKTAKDQIKAYYNEIYSGNPTIPLNEILDDVYKIVQAEREAGRAGKSWLDIFKDKKIHSFLGQAASMFSFYDLINAGRQGINVIKDLDSAYTEMRKVSDETAQSLKNFQSDSFDVAKQVGVTALEIQNSAADFMRLGYSLKEASKLSEDANIYANVGDMDIGEATEHMISSIQAWQSEFSSATEASTNIINRYNEVGNRFAITSADIGSAMERSAAALKAGGNDLNEAIGIITAGNLIQQDADATANAIKVLSLRLRGAKADLESMNEETDGLVESTSKMREQIQALTGVDIMIDDSTFKSTAKIIQEIGAEWSNLSDVSQAATLELLAGKTRASTVAGLIENYQTIGEVIEAAEESENSARIENEKYLDSMEGRLNLMTSQLQEMASVSLNDNLLKEGISALTKILELTTNIVDTFGALPTVFTTGGIGAFIANFTWPSMATNNYNLSYSF